MKRANLTRQRLVLLAMLGGLLFSFPIVGLVDGIVLGLPAGYLYLFGVWAALILMAARLSEGGR